ncbi:pilus assembly protein CpaB [Litoreibacter ponti]|uniref:Pilus assembly protein CpaB n=1 Tax=Litoreibacter ponti TaxID=1510457 RepID=A0A2T6BF19_9RHOB|nr:Flp pilus assembly protein CpaB [Litoreibacter ponti]PTX54651.1 pilus assembly protein CpaB [Litoreibacter ponti]
MRIQPVLFAVFGLLLVVGSILFSQGMFSQQNSEATQLEADTVKLIAAAVDIPFGSEITRDKLWTQEWPAGSVPEGAYEDLTALLGAEGTAPRRAKQAFSQGDLILSDKVTFFGASVTISTALKDVTRAMAIKVSAETAVGGFVSPGDRVDVVLTQGRGETLRTGTILQDIRVLGIDQNADESSRGAREARTITVEVTPRGGQVLALSQQAGILSLTLRNDASNSAEVQLEQITMQDVWGEATPAPLPMVLEPEERTVRVRRGVDRQDVVLE